MDRPTHEEVRQAAADQAVRKATKMEDIIVHWPWPLRVIYWLNTWKRNSLR